MFASQRRRRRRRRQLECTDSPSENGGIGGGEDDDDDDDGLLSGGFDMYRLEFERIPASFTGTGDLIAALLLAWTHRYPTDLLRAIEHAGATIQSVLYRTWRATEEQQQLLQQRRGSSAAKSRSASSKELRLVQSKRDIESPLITNRAHSWTSHTVRAVIFDMDGTLTLPGQIDFAALRQTLGMGKRDTDICDFVDNLTSPLQREEAWETVRREELRSFQEGDGVGLQPGLVELLAAIKAAGIPVAIATRNCVEAVDEFLIAVAAAAAKTAATGDDGDSESLAVSPPPSTAAASVPIFFSPIITRDFESVKPDPGVAIAVCREWQLDPRSVLFVGDSMDDMACGHAAGCQTLLLVNDSNRLLARESEVHFTAQSLDDVRDLINTAVV
jgi:phosphoglycolate phosphatase-like HAD superfamily hydrolase